MLRSATGVLTICCPSSYIAAGLRAVACQIRLRCALAVGRLRTTALRLMDTCYKREYIQKTRLTAVFAYLYLRHHVSQELRNVIRTFSFLRKASCELRTESVPKLRPSIRSSNPPHPCHLQLPLVRPKTAYVVPIIPLSGTHDIVLHLQDIIQ